jgi:hypothetical protein
LDEKKTQGVKKHITFATASAFYETGPQFSVCTSFYIFVAAIGQIVGQKVNSL